MAMTFVNENETGEENAERRFLVSGAACCLLRRTWVVKSETDANTNPKSKSKM